MTLRDELQRITDRYLGDEVGQQIRHVAALRVQFPHTIEVALRAIPGRPETFDFNCFRWALDLVGNRLVEEASRRPPPANRFAGSVFVRSLLPSLSPLSAPEPGVVRRLRGKPTHAGRWLGDCVRSKWSAHTWDHAPLEDGGRAGARRWGARGSG